MLEHEAGFKTELVLCFWKSDLDVSFLIWYNRVATGIDCQPSVAIRYVKLHFKHSILSSPKMLLSN